MRCQYWKLSIWNFLPHRTSFPPANTLHTYLHLAVIVGSSRSKQAWQANWRRYYMQSIGWPVFAWCSCNTIPLWSANFRLKAQHPLSRHLNGIGPIIVSWYMHQCFWNAVMRGSSTWYIRSWITFNIRFFMFLTLDYNDNRCLYSEQISYMLSEYLHVKLSFRFAQNHLQFSVWFTPILFRKLVQMFWLNKLI